jgi:hypothetical protein
MTLKESVGQGKPSFVFPKGNNQGKTQIGRNKTDFKHRTGLTEPKHERAGREWGSLVPPNMRRGRAPLPPKCFPEGEKEEIQIMIMTALRQVLKKRFMYKAQRNLGQMPKPRPAPRLQIGYSGACVCLGWWGIVMVSLEISGKLKKTQKHRKIQIHG